MREIKFRGRDKRNGSWRRGYYNVITHKSGPVNDPRIETIRQIISGERRYVVEPDTVGQYTGLHDSTEQEVYEGDILRDARGRLYVIVWQAGGPCVYNAYEYRDLCHRAPYTLHDALADEQVSDYVQEGLTVVGNIHDNPELLREEK